MKKTLLVLLVIFVVKKSFSQNIYNDAVELGSHSKVSAKVVTITADNTAPDSVLRLILNKYFLNSLSLAPDSLGKLMRKNPFLINFKYSGTGQSQSLNAQSLGLGNALPAVGALNIANFADGLSQFLIKRAKEELLISFFSKLQDSTKFPEFRIVFPNTAAIVDNFNAWEYANIVNTMRAAFNKDLKNLLADIPNLSNLNPSDKTTYPDSSVRTRMWAIKRFLSKDGGRILISAMQVGNGFINGTKIPDIIDIISGPNYLGGLANSNEKNVIKLIDILSQSVSSNEADKSYIDITNLTGMDTVTTKLFLGLLYQQILNEGITIFGHNLASDIKQNIQIADKYLTYIKTLITKANKIDADIANLNEAKVQGDTALTKYWSAIFDSGKQFLQYATNTTTLNPLFTLPPTLKKATDLSISTLEIATDIGNKNYTDALTVIVKMISDNSSNKSDVSDIGIFIVKYGSFAANIVQAKTADGVEKAIESVALPAGSYTIKQKSVWNISLNGYVGYAWDFTRVQLNSKYLFANGIYAPVGFSGNWGLNKNRGAITVFASVIDVGALVMYNLNKDSTSTLKQNITLESIISPSAQAFYEIPNWPLSIGFGWRRTPKLFYSQGSNFQVIQPRGVFNFSILIDIPILTLHNSPRMTNPKDN